MHLTHKLVSALFALAATVAYSAESEITADKTALGDWPVEVAAGDVVRVSASQSGTGKIVKSGAGSLILEGNNTFSGGVEVNEGTVEPHHDNAFGTGTVTINADGVKECRVAFMKGELTIANNFELIGTSAIDKPAFYFGNGPNVLSGNISAQAGDFYMLDDGTWCYLKVGGYYDSQGKLTGKKWSNDVAPNQFMTFNGNINVAGTVYLVPDGKMTFNGTVTCDTLDTCYRTGLFTVHGTSDSSFYGVIHFNAQVRARQFNAAYAERCFNGGLLGGVVYWPSQWNNGSSVVYFIGSAAEFSMAGFTSIFPRKYPDSAYGNIRGAGNSQIVLTGEGVNNEENTLATHSQLGNGASDNFNLTLDATGVNPGFTQVFAGRHNRMIGALRAVNGTIRFEGQSSCSNVTELIIGENGAIEYEGALDKAFAGVTNIAVGANGRLRFENISLTEALGTEIASLELVGSSVIESPVREGEVLRVGSLTINGSKVQCGMYAANEFGGVLPAGLGLVVTGVLPGTDTAVWTDADEGDSLMTTLGNWENLAALPNLNFGRTKVTIASGTAMAPGEGHTRITSIDYQIPLSGDGQPFVLGAVGRTLEVAGDISCVKKAQMIVRGTIAPPEGVGDQGKPEKGGSNTFYYQGLKSTAATWNPNYVKGNSSTYVQLVLDNATIAKPYYSDGGAYNADPEVGASAGSCVLYSTQGTTNRIAGRSRFDSAGWTHFMLKPDSLLEFTGAVDSPNRIVLMGNGTMRLAAPWSGNTGLTLEDDGTKLIIDSENNTFGQADVALGLDIRYKSGSIEFRRSNAFAAAQQLSMRSGTSGTIDFNSTTQTVARFGAVATSKASLIRGDALSLIEITGGCKETKIADSACAPMACSVQVEGALSFRMTGTGKGNTKGIVDGANDTYVLRDQDFQSCGNLEVTGGALELAVNATWKNGTNFIAGSAGTLRLAGTNQLSRDFARITIKGEGKLFLGGNQYVMGAEVIDGEGNVTVVPNGWYDANGTGVLARHILSESTGRLRVGTIGTTLILR